MVSLVSISVFLITFVALSLYIRCARKRGIGQLIKKDGPDLHGYKEGTPTMGGIVFVPMILLGMIMLKVPLFIIVSTAAFMVIGLLDDISSFLLKDAYGMKARWKFLLQIAVAVVISYVFLNRTQLYIPFYGDINLGNFYPLFAALVLVSTVNAVNITDGLDGLASLTMMTSLLPMNIYILMKGGHDVSTPVVLSALTAFLFFNAKPASVFMGDTGSLALGGYLGALSIVHGMEIPLILFGFIFVLETLSVIIQVISFKTTGKRVFKMAPLHHHFELVGWQENKIVIVFASFNLLFALIPLGWSL